MTEERNGNPANPAAPKTAPTSTLGAYRVAGVVGTPYQPSRPASRVARGGDAEHQPSVGQTDASQPENGGQSRPPGTSGERAAAGSLRPVETPFTQPTPEPLARNAQPVMPTTPPPPPRRWQAGGSVLAGFLALLVLFGGFGLWSWGARIAGAVVATGQVEVQQHRQVVQHLDGGVVDEILVREGQTVVAGQPLMRLDGALLRTELAIVEGQYFEILSRRGRLEAERADKDTLTFAPELVSAAQGDDNARTLMDGQTSLFRARLDTLHQSLSQLEKQAEQIRSQIEGIDAQKTALTEQRALIGKELADAQTLLAKGLAQAPRVLALQREAARLDGQVGELTSARAQAEGRITEIGIERLRQSAERREGAETELRDLGYRALELAERRRSLTEQIARLEIRAPVSGIVHQLQVTTPSAVIRAAEPVMFLIPQDRPLVIAAKIAPINVDEVRVGQPVVLRFSAFSSRTTPEIDGMLAQISADALVDEATKIPYYRAEVTIPPEQLDKLGTLALVPGMPVEVYVQTGERSPLAYLFKPLSDYFSRAFRET